MAIPLLIDRLRVENAYGALDTAQQANVDPDDIALALQEASDIAWGILRPGFAAEEIIKLAASDEGVRGAIAAIVADVMARKRPHLRLPDGRTLYAADRRQAELHLTRIADGNPRTVAEELDINPAKASRLLNDRTRPLKKSVLDGGGF